MPARLDDHDTTDAPGRHRPSVGRSLAEPVSSRAGFTAVLDHGRIVWRPVFGEPDSHARWHVVAQGLSPTAFPLQ